MGKGKGRTIQVTEKLNFMDLHKITTCPGLPNIIVLAYTYCLSIQPGSTCVLLSFLIQYYGSTSH